MRLRRSLPRTLLGFAVAVGLLGALVLVTLPPRPRTAVPVASDPAIALDHTPRTPVYVATGAFHVHTVRSDGSGTRDEVLAAAARAGVHFVVFTDHGDGTRAPLAPDSRSGVLGLDGVEISTEGGHYVALGLPRTPYRLAGEPRDVVEDVHRFGGFGVAAHPDSPKAELAWQGWDTPIDGLEWFNLDTEWRDERTARLLLGLLHYPLRPAPALGALVTADRPLLARWDRLVRARRVVGLAAVDAHARVGADAGPGGSLRLRVPSYEASFNAARIAIELPARLTGDPAGDAQTVVDALREGRSYGWIDAFARAGRVEFRAQRADGASIPMGQFAGSFEGASLHAAAAAPDSSEIRVVCDGAVVATAPAPGPVLYRVDAPAPAACRMEVVWPVGRRFVRWLVTNPIYGRSTDPPGAAPAGPFTASEASAAALDQAAWIVEKDRASDGRVDTRSESGSRRLAFHYRLGAGPRGGQYAALVAQPIAIPNEGRRLRFTASADRPMRLSVQLRQPGDDGQGLRWRRSIYLDAAPRAIDLRFDDFRPIERHQAARPALDRVDALLFVVDTLNTPPGESGTVTIDTRSPLEP